MQWLFALRMADTDLVPNIWYLKHYHSDSWVQNKPWATLGVGSEINTKHFLKHNPNKRQCTSKCKNQEPKNITKLYLYFSWTLGCFVSRDHTVRCSVNQDLFLALCSITAGGAQTIWLPGMEARFGMRKVKCPTYSTTAQTNFKVTEE